MNRSIPHLAAAGFLAALAAGLVFLNWHGSTTPEPAQESIAHELADTHNQEPISPLPRSITVSPAKAKLGERLFNDPILSSDHTISCASCHILQLGGTDRQRTSLGVGGKRGAVNAPTVFNTAFNFFHFWDGRAASLEEQAGGPITNPVEMNLTWPEVLARLQADPEYRADFVKIYPEGISEASVADAIASYERTLITPDSPFDRYLRGEHDAIDENARRGYALFKSYGCASCHQGVNVGGNMFQRFGVMGDYFADRGNLTKADLGRYNVTGNPDDRYVFRVPSLRNVAITPPYFHDGSAERLEEAVAIMARYQLGRDLSEEDNRLIVAFLKTLTGNLDGKPLQ